MKFELLAQDGGARAGRVTVARDGAKPLETPCAVLPTRKGHVPFVTPDLAPHLPLASAIHLHVSDMVEDKASLKAVAPEGDGARKFYRADPSRALYVGVRDAASFFDQPINPKRLTLPTRHGNAHVTAAEYVELAKLCGADFVESMNGDVAPTDSLARNKKCSFAGLKWLDECIEASKGQVDILGVIQGGPKADMRAWYASEVSKRQVAGFVLGGFGYGEPTVQRNELIKTTLGALPKDKVVLIPGVGSPEDVLELVEMGVDMFYSNYPNAMTELGCALCFSFDPSKPLDPSVDPHKINLRDTIFALDKSPLVDGCSCFACTKHTRGYIHHLLNAHEMLADILLSLHNNHYYTAFFAAIRSHISNGKFSQLKAMFPQN